MSPATLSNVRWSKAAIRETPLRTLAIVAFLIARCGFAVFFAYGFWHKLAHGWLWTDALQQHFLRRLSDGDLAAFQAGYLEHMAIPFYLPITWFVTIGELVVALGLMLGIATRANAALALFMLLNFAAGGYFNPGLPPFMIFALLAILLPSGHWLGCDNWLSERYPDSPWFK
jgi:thiosulfate dehydrogenase [quinone] large subunit